VGDYSAVVIKEGWRWGPVLWDYIKNNGSMDERKGGIIVYWAKINLL
jgi:hypothetical protein